MFLFLQSDTIAQLPDEAGLSLSDAADIANVIVAILAFVFSMYSFWIQRKRDRKNYEEANERQIQSEKDAAEKLSQSKIEAEKLRIQAIQLQWYKDLVISPNIEHLDEFYETLHEIRTGIEIPDLDSGSKIEIIDKVKAAHRQIRKTLVDSILLYPSTCMMPYMPIWTNLLMSLQMLSIMMS